MARRLGNAEKSRAARYVEKLPMVSHDQGRLGSRRQGRQVRRCRRRSADLLVQQLRSAEVAHLRGGSRSRYALGQDRIAFRIPIAARDAREKRKRGLHIQESRGRRVRDGYAHVDWQRANRNPRLSSDWVQAAAIRHWLRIHPRNDRRWSNASRYRWRSNHLVLPGKSRGILLRVGGVSYRRVIP